MADSEWAAMMNADPSAVIRLRFRELLHDARVSQGQLCQRMTKRTGTLWRASRVSKILSGRIAWQVDDLVMMAQEAGISLIDLFREPGRQFVADMTPSELRILSAIREHPELSAVLVTLLAASAPTRRSKVPRQIIKERMRLGR